MSIDRDWEKTLHDGQYDLPAETWQRMENDMRGWLAREARQQVAPAPAAQRNWLAWVLRPSRWGTALAGLAIAGVTFHYAQGRTETIDWAQGQARVLDHQKLLHWSQARAEVQGSLAHLTLARMDDQVVQVRLDGGQATFHVQPRRAGESFLVDLAKDCQVQVVGTAFTVGVDSSNAWVSVQEGQVRLLTAGADRFVAGGERAVCSVPSALPAATANAKDSAVTDSPAVAPVAKSMSGSVAGAVVRDSVQVPSCNEPGPCVELLSAFVRNHPDHPAVSEVSLRWGRLAARGGDPRDALVGYAHVSSPVIAPIARIESMELRVREFGQAKDLADSLDRWLGQLNPTNAIWKRVALLRVDVHRRQGDDSGARRLQEKINGISTAKSRGR